MAVFADMNCAKCKKKTVHYHVDMECWACSVCDNNRIGVKIWEEEFRWNSRGRDDEVSGMRVRSGQSR
jgi:hypothetical protein